MSNTRGIHVYENISGTIVKAKREPTSNVSSDSI